MKTAITAIRVELKNHRPNGWDRQVSVKLFSWKVRGHSSSMDACGSTAPAKIQ